MKRTVFGALVVLLVAILTSCMSLTGAGNDSSSTSSLAAQADTLSQPSETQMEKFQRIFLADSEKLVVGENNITTIDSIESTFQPKEISSLGEITDTALSEPGRPYYYKIRAIFKGYDKSAERALLQDAGDVKQASQLEGAIGAVFGTDSNIYTVPIIGGERVVSTLPQEANSIATFYLVATRITDDGTDSAYLIRFVRNIEKASFDPSKFIVVNGMHYITVADAHVTTQEDVMMHYFSGGVSGNSSSSVFDPMTFPFADLMDARVAMDKKDYRNDNTLPTVRIKHVSEVLFKGQVNTTITVSTDDNVLTERMDFKGRATGINNGDKIRVYYTIAKDPLEIWEVQAIEKL